MSRIESLTDSQKVRMDEFRDKWISIGLSTDPADRNEAEKAIVLVYKCRGLCPPKKIVWCGSPLSQSLTRASILDKKIGASVRVSVGNSVVNSVRNSVVNTVWNSVWNSVVPSVVNSVWNSVVPSVVNSVRNTVGASVRNSVVPSVVPSVVDSVRASVWASVYGQHGAHWLAFYDYFNLVVGLEGQTQKLKGLWSLAKSAGWAIPHEKICWVSERHNILKRDVRGRLHNFHGPAVMYPDGWGIYAVHGVRVPGWIIEQKEKITTELISNETNSEIRRVMIDQYGQDKYLIDSGAEEVARDDCGVLYKKDIQDDEPLVMVKVLNATRELDGGRKAYFLRVPPDIVSAQNAVAWTFGMGGEEYFPLKET